MSIPLLALVNYLERNFNPLFNLYKTVKRRTPPVPTQHEVQIANGTTSLDDERVKKHLEALEAKAKEAMEYVNSVSKYFSPLHSSLPMWTSLVLEQDTFDQARFERLIAEWLVIADHPFTEIEQPTLRQLLQYVHGSEILNIPSSTTIRRRIMDLSAATIEQTRTIIHVSCRFCLSEEKIVNFCSF